MFRRLFVDHPQSVDETYFEHMGVSASFGLAMFAGALACFVHALVPGFFEKTGSSIINRLYSRMVTNRNRKLAAIDAERVNA